MQWVLAVLSGALAVSQAQAVEVKVSAQAIERTLRAQLFKGVEGRHYIRGNESSGCSVYADNPQVSFRDDRVVVHLHARARLGKSIRGSCLGITLNRELDVSFVPQAEGESVGFRDARIENLSNSSELDFLLVPFLSQRLPAEMKLNASELLRTLLARAPESTGYTLTLSSLELHSMAVQDNVLLVDLDAKLSVD